MFNIAPYIPKYVRALHADGEGTKVPYTQTNFGVVLMVDVCGFSQLTTIAGEKGDMGAEAVALEVGTYSGECIRIIEAYGGDIVKFLGDAVLVSFQPTRSDCTPTAPNGNGTAMNDAISEADDYRMRAILVRRALECSLQLLARLSNYRVYLTPGERVRHRSSEGSVLHDVNGLWVATTDSRRPSTASGSSIVAPRAYNDELSLSFGIWNLINFLLRKRKNADANVPSLARRQSFGSDMSHKDIQAVDLDLHIALAAGDLTNVIVGQDSLGQSHDMPMSDFNSDETITVPNGRLEYAICGEAVEALDDALTTAKAGEMSITKKAWSYINASQLDVRWEVHKNCYLIRSSVNSGRGSGNAFMRLLNENLLPRSRTTSAVSPSSDAANYYSMYINRSALCRLQRSADGNFPAQFRDATIVFVSLGDIKVATDEGLQIAQRATTLAIQVLDKYEGMLQQFAVDDKGATLLAVFGLPPLSHENEPTFAAKAAIELRDLYETQGIPDFAISLATGTIFTVVLPQGNEYRRDPAIAGDTIILAVRMLKFAFAHHSVICDAATKERISQFCELEDMGQNFVKGKVKPITIYKIKKFASEDIRRPLAGTSDSSINVDFIGYRTEMEAASRLIDGWMTAKNQHVLVVCGPSGVGKSFFCATIQKSVQSHGVYVCPAQATEVEKGTKYFLMKGIVLQLFEIIDSDAIPERYTDDNASDPPDLLAEMAADDNGSMLTMESASSGHSVRDKEWYRKLVYQAMLSPSADSIQEVLHMTLRCLKKCGEDALVLPLFRTLFTSLDLQDNKFTRRLDGQGKDILFTNLMIRMFKYVSEHGNLIISCDDVQWADEASISLLRAIHDNCPRVLLLLASRPLKDYNVKFVDEICRTGACLKISLNGLDTKEIGKIILQTFKRGVTKVSPQILKVIQSRTGGNPLYVKNMAIVLKDFNHVAVVDGELVPNSSNFDLEDLLGNFDYKRIIKMQFDRLNNSFQEFLKIACSLDSTFTLSEVRAVISPTNAIFQANTSAEISETIAKYDTYNFLLKSGEIDPTHQGSDDVYTFTHVTIPHSIYDTLPYETRIFIHRALARYYEAIYIDTNRSNLLIKIARHYLETDNIDKQLKYLEALAEYNMRSHYLPEATTSLERIVKILDENPEYDRGYGKMHKADIYYRLGQALAMRTQLTEGEMYLHKALGCLGTPWPDSHLDFVLNLSKYRVRQKVHRRRVRRNHQAFKIVQDEAERQTWMKRSAIMVQLSNVYYYTGQGRKFVLSCLVGLDACQHLGEDYPDYTLFLARFALVCWLNDQRDNSLFYIRRALALVAKDHSDMITLTVCAQLCFASGKFSSATELIYEACDVTRAYGAVTDCQAFYRTITLLATIRIFEGTLNQNPKDQKLLKLAADTAHQMGDFEAEIWLSVFTVANAIVNDQLRNCEPFILQMENHLRDARDFNKIAMYGTLIAYYARIGHHSLARKYFRDMVAVLPPLATTSNLLPIFGLIFATMGLYEIVEAGVFEAVAAIRGHYFERFVTSVVQLNHAFQKVKFWEFCQPSLYLARALPYISTGRVVEGFLVLRHGVMEMQYIQEIRFLKAYYHAKLGKYAFTAEDRVSWTDQARQELDALKIPASVYCNPNPSAETAIAMMRDVPLRVSSDSGQYTNEHCSIISHESSEGSVNE
ncbi:hypothetical protein BZG36_03026 [Bifiguratus adelaidae]|uniref:Orc1-like AAA ATPase domain-containing protein n=1 Tax=Bifiguratus adelaidae TaxID=1938954 RepID=A0A261XZM9_9FUNG|nr:hypothetical protein BZG36_03026 [Bifiguratus adelaidae]